MLKPFVTAALVVAGLSVTAAPAQAVEPATCAETPVVAHRGLVEAGHTENTRAAARAAIAEGAWFEVDLRQTANDRVVLMHDRSISRTTNGTGRVADLSAAKIRSYATNDGGRVPFVAAVLRDVQADPSARAVLDLKALDGVGQRSVRDTINDLGISARVEAISFHEPLLATFRRLNPNVDTFHIEGRGLPTIPTARANGGAHVFPQLITQEWAERMNDASVPYGARIDDTNAGYQAGLTYAVTSIMSDDVSAYRTYCSSRAI